jgi:hypothetical protein
MMYKPFTPARFENLVKEFQEQEAKILSHKGNEYSDQEDRLLNFREVAEFQGRSPAEVALAYLMKHVQSIALAVKTGKYAWAWETEGGEGLKQRIADARNYLLLLAACLEEQNDSVMFDGLDLIADVLPDYALGRRRGLTDEETERRARAAMTWAINRILDREGEQV